jgi:hypothetical protein
VLTRFIILVMFFRKYLCSLFPCDGFQVLRHLLYLMRVGEKSVQRRVALALAHLCAPEDQRTIFIDNNGINSLSLTEEIIFSFRFHCVYVLHGLNSG